MGFDGSVEEFTEVEYRAVIEGWEDFCEKKSV